MKVDCRQDVHFVVSSFLHSDTSGRFNSSFREFVSSHLVNSIRRLASSSFYEFDTSLTTLVLCRLSFWRFVVSLWHLPFQLVTKAPSTHIRICLNPQLFLSGFKISLSTRWIEFASPHASDQENMTMVSCPMASEFTLVPSAPLQLNVFRARAIKHVVVAENLLCFCCAAILVYRSVRD